MNSRRRNKRRLRRTRRVRRNRRFRKGGSVIVKFTAPDSNSPSTRAGIALAASGAQGSSLNAMINSGCSKS